MNPFYRKPVKPGGIYWSEFPECPHCGEPDQDWWDGLQIRVEDGTKWSANCGNCGCDYTVTASVDIEFATAAETRTDSEVPA